MNWELCWRSEQVNVRISDALTSCSNSNRPGTRLREGEELNIENIQPHSPAFHCAGYSLSMTKQ